MSNSIWEARREELAKAVDAGCTVRELGEVYGVCGQRISAVCGRMKIWQPAVKGWMRERLRKVQMLHQRRLTTTQIASALRLTEGQVKYALSLLQLRPVDPLAPQKDLAVEMYDRGDKIVEINQRTGVSTSRITRLARARGVRTRTPDRLPRGYWTPDKVERACALVASGLSPQRAAKKMKLPEMAVRNMLVDKKIKVRDLRKPATGV